MATDVARSSTSDYRAIQRFADKDIVGDVKELLANYASNNELLWFLLRMVWQGELAGGLPEAKKFALNPKARSEERRVGKEGVRTGRCRWSPHHEKENKRLY